MALCVYGTACSEGAFLCLTTRPRFGASLFTPSFVPTLAGGKRPTQPNRPIHCYANDSGHESHCESSRGHLHHRKRPLRLIPNKPLQLECVAKRVDSPSIVQGRINHDTSRWHKIARTGATKNFPQAQKPGTKIPLKQTGNVKHASHVHALLDAFGVNLAKTGQVFNHVENAIQKWVRGIPVKLDFGTRHVFNQKAC